MNRLSRRFVVLMVVVVSACNSPDHVTETSTYKPSNTLSPASVTPLPSLTPTPRKPSPSLQPSVSPTLTLSVITRTEFEPQLVRICPNNPFVSLDDIGLPPELRFVLLPTDYLPGKSTESGFWVLAPQDAKPQAITRVAPGAGMVNKDYQLSPDGRYISFLQRSKAAEGPESELAMLWLSSLDGRQLWPVKQTHRDSNILWVTEQDIVIFEAGSDGDTRILLNPFTGEEEILAPVPHQGIDWYTVDHFLHDGIFYTVYVDALLEGYTYFLYNQASNKSQRIFTWFDPYLYLENDFWRLEDNTFFSTVNLPDGIDISSRLDLETIQEDHTYDDIMRHIRLAAEILPAEVRQVTFDARLAILTETDLEMDQPVPVADYILDLGKMIVKSYCVERDGGSILSLSPDGQFAQLVYEDTDGKNKWFGILNLETGYITRNENYQMLGWGFGY